VIELRFSYFVTESNNDVVRVYDGIDSSAPLIASLSGIYNKPPNCDSTQRNMFVQFTSDGSNAFPGFFAVYRSVIPGESIDHITGLNIEF
jgi:hypothetical protein